MLAGAVLYLVEFCAVEGRLVGMHDHHIVEVVDPEILDLVVAHVAQRGHRQAFGVSLAELAGAGLGLVVGDRGMRHFHQIADARLSIFQELCLAAEEDDTQQQEQGKADENGQGCQFATQGELGRGHDDLRESEPKDDIG